MSSSVLLQLDADIQVASSLGYLDVAPDGQRFLAARAVRAENGTPPRLLLVQNWFTELAARLGG